jgi:hypothetical protein
LFFKSLSLSDTSADNLRFGSFFKWASRHLFPMGEDALWEGSS